MGKVLTVLAGWLAKWVGEKVAIFSVAVASMAVLVGGFTYAMSNLMNDVVPNLHPLVRAGVSLLPASVGVYWGIIVASMALRWAFDQQLLLIKMAKSSAK